MSETTGQKHINPSRKGDLAEYYAVTWLWDNGYEVFTNAGCTGPIDMIAFKDNETVFIDVKTASIDNRDNSFYVRASRTKEQIELGVIILEFNPETRKLKWVNHRE